MTTAYEKICAHLASNPRRWCVTGAAGFIGSHLVIKLLSLNQIVTGLDNFATGLRSNLEAISASVSAEQYVRFSFIEGDIRNAADCARAMQGAELVSHQAALGSVPRSIADPLTAFAVNIDGFTQVLTAARDAQVKRFVYASSSSVYGDSPELPKVEARVGNVLSPYALTKSVNEQTAAVFASCYGINAVGLRYFNVFGPRQDPNGPYAAVLPRWKAAILAKTQPVIFGDGETSRDFCHVDNAVQANILAATTESAQLFASEKTRVFNVACGEQHTLKQTLGFMLELAGATDLQPHFEPFRAGDIRHSLADIGAIQSALGYQPTALLRDGLKQLIMG